MDRFSELEAFVAVVDEESFSEAARRLGVSKSYVSKRISALEERLGAVLLQRTTRQLQLTDVGATFYERCVRVLEELDEAECVVNALQTTPRGTLRVSAPVSFGVRYLSPLVAEFMRTYPDMSVELVCSDRTVNLIEEGFDMAVRIGELEDSTLRARKLAEVSRVVCASPEYIAAAGWPQRPEDLSDHNCLLYSYQRGGPSWSFEPARGGGGTSHVKVSGTLTANHGDVLLDAALRGVGVALLPEFFAREAIARGELIRLLPEWCNQGAGGVWAIYPEQRHLALKVRLFVDLLVERFDGEAWTQLWRA